LAGRRDNKNLPAGRVKKLLEIMSASTTLNSSSVAMSGSTFDDLTLTTPRMAETTTPSIPGDGEGGLLYTKSDGRLYFISNEISEIDLTVGIITALNNATANELVTVGATTTELDAESNLTFDGSTLTITGDLSSNGAAVFNDAGADKDFRVESDTEAHALFVDAGANELHINKGESAFLTTIHNVVGEAISVTATEVVINNDGAALIDFRIESDGEDEAFFLNASSNKLHINKGETDFDTHIYSENDIAITVNDAGVIFNDDGHATNDFRIESDDETHMFFMDASSNRISIGDNTGSPGATLEVKNNASAGASGVPLVQLNSNDTDQQCLDINASNITANVVNITANDVTTARVLAIGADGLTTGNALYVDDNSSDTGTRNTALVIQNHASAIAATAFTVQSDGGITGIKLDKNFSDTTAATVTGLNIDFDKTGASTSNNTMYGLNIDMDNTTATNGNNYMYGLHVTPTLTHAADAGGAFVYGALINAQGSSNGSSLVQGARIEASGGDTNFGLQLDVEDGGVDLRIESSADNGDYFQIQTTTHGATTITTYDDDATAANLTFDVDGAMTIDAANHVGVGTTDPKTALSVVHDYATTTFENQLSDNEGGGHIIKYGAGTLTAGMLYYLHTDATWTATDSDAVASGGSQLLGIALGTSPTSHGVLLKGYAKIASGYVNGTAAIGQPVYVDNGTAGEYTFTAPSGNADFVRIVGYCIDIDSSDILLYFDPDKTWVKVVG